MARIASATLRPCDTKTSACRSLATISSGLCPFFAISVLLRLEAIPQDGPLQWGRITRDLDLPVGERRGLGGRMQHSSLLCVPGRDLNWPRIGAHGRPRRVGGALRSASSKSKAMLL